MIISAMDKRLQYNIIIAIVSSIALIIAFLYYIKFLSSILIIMIVSTLANASARRLRTTLLCSAIGALLFFTAFYTTFGYFWLNRSRLEALVTQIQAVPAITSLELGSDGTIDRKGKVQRYDAYRFVNDRLVTHYREQAAPHASPQPQFYIGDMLQHLHVAPATYYALRASLQRLSLVGYYRNKNGEIGLTEPYPWRAPWGYSFVFSPADTPPQATNIMESRRLAHKWYYVMEG